jgi:hypothetical protein
VGEDGRLRAYRTPCRRVKVSFQKSRGRFFAATCCAPVRGSRASNLIAGPGSANHRQPSAGGICHQLCRADGRCFLGAPLSRACGSFLRCVGQGSFACRQEGRGPRGNAMGERISLRMPDALILATADLHEEIDTAVCADDDWPEVKGLSCKVELLKLYLDQEQSPPSAPTDSTIRNRLNGYCFPAPQQPLSVFRAIESARIHL